MTHDEFEDLAALDAIGAASLEERMALGRHLDECDRCSQAQTDFQTAASMMALGFDRIPPPPELRSRILKAIDEDPRQETIETDNVIPIRRSASSWWMATAAIFFIALFGWSELRVRAERERLSASRATVRDLSEENRRLQHRNELMSAQVAAISSSQTTTIGLTGQEMAPSASARVFLDGPGRRAFVFFHNMPQNGTKSYQLWVIPKDSPQPRSAGTFEVNGQGEASIVVENLPVATEIKALAVTLEPKGGLTAPSGKMVLMGSSSL